MQQDLFSNNNDTPDTVLKLPMDDADIHYYPDFLGADQAQLYFNLLHQTLLWRQEQIEVYGKRYTSPRLQAWYGDKEASYQYSALSLRPIDWTPELTDLKKLCEQKCNAQFNSVLANLYRDGQDGMGMHSDDEKELGPQPVIASLSLGQVREVLFSHKQTKQKVRLPLAAGSLLLMKGTTQQYWQHGIAKRKTPLGARINLTFRYIYPQI